MLTTLNLVGGWRENLPLYELDETRQWGVDSFVTGRGGGVSVGSYDSLNLATHVGDDIAHVTENRRRVAAAQQLDATALVTSHQVHGTHVNDIDQWNNGPLVGDALVSTRSDVALCVLVADCLPLLMIDTAGPRFAVVHAGWRGLVAGVIAATLAHFENPGALRVVVGPHISTSGYQVGPDVAQHFLEVDGAVHADVGDRSRLDLAVIAQHQLTLGGVATSSIALCAPTTDGGTFFFSDRAQRPCGRFGMVARRLYDASAKEGDR